MKLASKKPRVTVKTGTETDIASEGGPYVSRFVRARVGTVRHNRKGKWVEPTGNGVEVTMCEIVPPRGDTEGLRQVERGEVYLSIEVQRGNRFLRAYLEGSLTPAQLDTMIELLTVGRDKARESGFLPSSPACRPSERSGPGCELSARPRRERNSHPPATVSCRDQQSAASTRMRFGSTTFSDTRSSTAGANASESSKCQLIAPSTR
jgi:hypothetical protein